MDGNTCRFAQVNSANARSPEALRTIDQIIIDVQNGSLDYLEAIGLAKALLLAAEIRGERKRSKGVTQ